MEQPDTIVIAKLEVIVMPNGEVICLGRTVGWFKDLKDYLTIPPPPGPTDTKGDQK